MKKILIFFVLFLVLSSPLVFSEKNEKKINNDSVEVEDKNSTAMLISPNVLGPLFGTVQIGLEFPIAKSLSLEINPSYFNVKISPFFGALIDTVDEYVDLELWSLQGELSLNYFFSRKALNKGFLGAYVKGSYFKGSIEDACLDLSSVGGGVKLGYRWVWGWLSIAPVAKLGYNYAFGPVAELFDSVEDPSLDYIKNMFDGFEYGCAINLSFAIRK